MAKKITVWVPEKKRVMTIKEGYTLADVQEKYPKAVKVRKPSLRTLEEWCNDCGCETVGCGCWVEPDGECSHGNPSWLLALGMI